MKEQQQKQKRGSVLIVALFVASVGGFLVASYLKSVIYELKQVDDTFARSNALNLATAGIEAGVLALNEDEWLGVEKKTPQCFQDAGYLRP